MVNEYTKSNNGKLLAAIVAMLMVVCAVAVVAMPFEADAAAPTANFDGVEATDITAEDGFTKVAGYDADNKILNITTATVLNITEDVTVDDLRIVLGADLKITGEGKLSITAATDGNAYNAYTVTFNNDDAVLYIDGADVTLDVNEAEGSVFNNMYAYTAGSDGAEGTWASPGNSGAVQLANEATLTVKKTLGSTTWLGAPASASKMAWLVVNNSVVNFNGTAAIQDVSITATNADINFNDVEVGPSIDAATFTNSTLDVSNVEKMGVYVKGDITLTGSSITVTGSGKDSSDVRSGVLLTTGKKVTMDDSSKINTDTFTVCDNWNGYLVGTGDSVTTIEGGSISGTFKPAMTEGKEGAADAVAENQPAYTLNGTDVTGNSTVDTSVVLAAGANGFNVDGNLRNKGTVDTSAGPITVSKDGKFTNTVDGNVTGEKPISGAGTVTNDGTMNAPVEVENYTNNNTYEAELSGSTTQTMWYPSNQSFIVPEGKTWTITNGNKIVIPGNLTVEGDIVVEDGGVLVIGGILTNDDTNRTGFGKAVIDGTLTVEEGAIFAVAYGAVDINGTADIDGTVVVGYGYSTLQMTALDAENAKATLNVNSDTALSEYSELKQFTGSKIVIASGVTMTLEGAFASAVAFDNNGAIVIDSEPADEETSEIVPCANAITVNMLADGASVEIKNLAIASGVAVNITDANLVKDSKTGETIGTTDESRVKIDSSMTGGAIISGITVVENFDGISKDTTLADRTLNSMDVSGTVSVSEIAEADAEKLAARLALVNGDITVADTLSVGEGVTLEVSGVYDAALTVSGYVPVNKDGKLTNNGVVTLAGEGHIYLAGSKNTVAIGKELNAAYYQTTVDTEDYNNYVTVDAAIAAANADSTIEEIELYGENTVTVSATLPAIDLTFVNSDTVLNIGDEDNRDVRLDIAAGASYGKTGTTNVEGTLYFNDRTDLKASEDTIKADVVSKQVDADGKLTKNGWAKYTNVYTAMNEASAGDVINVFEGATVELDRDFTVKEGVTLIVPDDAQIKLLDGVTLTVAGTLQSESTAQGIVAESMFAKKAVKSEVEPETNASAIVVTGTLKVVEVIVYETDTPATTLASGSFVSGAYYSDGDYNYVTPLATAVSGTVLPTIIEGIGVYGAVTEGDTTFAATDDCDTITVYGQLTLSSLTLSNEAILATSGTGWYSGTVTVGDASVQAVKVTGLKIDSDEGLVIDNATVKYIADGKTDTPENNEAVFTATAGTVVIDGTVIGNMTVAAGATVTVPSAESSDKTGTVDGALTVDGTVTVGNGQTLNVDDLYVNGTVTVAAQTDAAAAGTLDVVSEKMFVGLDAEFETTGTAASVNGYVDVDTIYAVAGSTLSDATVTDEMESTEYYVEDALWITVYTSADAITIYDADMDKAVPVENAYFAKTWTDSDGKKYSATENSAAIVGSVSAVYAQVNYDVYVINLRADQNAVSSISIDGSLMQFGMIGNAMTGYYYGYTAIVDAGAHTIQYQLANGYSGNGVLTVNGTQQSGLTFTTEGTPTADDEVNGVEGMLQYNLQLTGFEKSGYVPDSPDTGSDSGDSGMGITDYLLIVLVVLIIVMAIIVAMRLMRS